MSGRLRIVDVLALLPGQIMRWPCRSTHSANYWNTELVGHPDFHAMTRVVAGQRWLYIWRDPSTPVRTLIPSTFLQDDNTARWIPNTFPI